MLPKAREITAITVFLRVPKSDKEPLSVAMSVRSQSHLTYSYTISTYYQVEIFNGNTNR